jgi:hypothetical protein
MRSSKFVVHGGHHLLECGIDGGVLVTGNVIALYRPQVENTSLFQFLVDYENFNLLSGHSGAN